MLDKPPCAGDAVALNEVAVVAADRAVDEDERHTVLRQRTEARPGPVADRRDQQALHLEGEHVLEVTPLALEVALGVAEDYVVTGSPRHLFGAADDEGEEGVRDVRHDQTDRAGLLPDQPAGEVVRHVAEVGDRRFDAPSGLLADARMLVDHAGHGHRRDTGPCCHLTHRHAHRTRALSVSEPVVRIPRKTDYTSLINPRQALDSVTRLC